MVELSSWQRERKEGSWAGVGGVGGGVEKVNRNEWWGKGRKRFAPWSLTEKTLGCAGPVHSALALTRASRSLTIPVWVMKWDYILQLFRRIFSMTSVCSHPSTRVSVMSRIVSAVTPRTSHSKE